jgi:thiol-disulfide isomerase/thioredoxin
MKCNICGKKFETLSSLRDHHRAVHPNAHFVVTKSRITKSLLVAIIIVLIAVSGTVGYLIYAQALKSSSNQSNGLQGAPITPSLYANLTDVSYSTLSTIGSNQSGVTPPKAIPGVQSQLLGPNGKPEVLYIGAEWCPFCAAERWSMIVALSKFGNFTGLQYMQSSSTDTFANTKTFTFYNSSYSSGYISFVAVEHEDRNHNTLQATTSQQQSIWSDYTGGGDNIPFLYFDGQFYLTGAQYSPGTLSNLNWTQIASQLNNPQSKVAQQIDGAANQIIGTICAMLKDKLWPTPQNLCSQSFATLAFHTQSNSASSSLLLSFMKNYSGNSLQNTATLSKREINFKALASRF